jgi:hypothetical protein
MAIVGISYSMSMARVDRTAKPEDAMDLTERFREELNFDLVGVIPEFVPFKTGGLRVEGRSILGVFGDVGGWKAAEGPLVHAVNNGCHVQLIFVGSSAKELTEQRLKIDTRCSVIANEHLSLESIAQYTKEPHDLLVLGASQSRIGIEAAATAALHSSAPAIAVQDLYGSSVDMLTLLKHKDALSNVRTVCVHDKFARKHLLRSDLEELSDRVVVTGGPQFDKVLGMKLTWNERRKAIRAGLTDDDLLVLIAGQLHDTAELIDLVTVVRKQLNLYQRLRLCVRQHPRASEEDRAATHALLSSLRDDPFHLLFDIPVELARTSEDIIPAADVVMSGYSTTNLYAILCELPGVIYAGTHLLKQDLLREKRLARPPEVSAGAGWYVETAEDLAHVFEELLRLKKGEESNDVRQIRENQRRIAQYNDGHATDRVWAEMQKLLAS